jgi:hypothetical protein
MKQWQDKVELKNKKRDLKIRKMKKIKPVSGMVTVTHLSIDRWDRTMPEPILQ